ncbi:histidinol-phosphate transaminase [Candidatus Sororendozoicomonas aggregata]|uniref:histidinol-phosphate transaminase n=1 Tax=Candidatus Sororendozoicomonas aggregata TaxID=3073239 RepID=UPI002ED202A8
MSIETLLRPAVKKLVPYQSARRLGSSGTVLLNANESPFDNNYTFNGQGLNRYSTCQPDALIQAYAHYAGVDASQVLTCRGADEGIELLIRAFCEPGQDTILHCPPTYGMYQISAEAAGVSCREIPLMSSWQVDLPAITKNLGGVKLVFLCSPNNPTGNQLHRQDIVALLEHTRGQALVVVDEAYVDFCPKLSLVDLLARYPHLVILRTLSKAFALAGLRCGFTLANPEVITSLLKVIAPYPVPVPVAAIAEQALSTEGIACMQKQVSVLAKNRDFLSQALSVCEGVTVFEGKGNYLLVKFPNADTLFRQLWDQGITLRKPTIKDCLRISIGSRAECEHVISAIITRLATL